jgi:hypothetical protein
MLVTPCGMLMLVKELQSLKAEYPMLVTPCGMLMLVKELQPLKVESPMLVTPCGNENSLILVELDKNW